MLTYMFNGNGVHAIPAYISTLTWVDSLIEPIVNWRLINNPQSYPQNIAKRIRRINAEISEIVPDKGK